MDGNFQVVSGKSLSITDNPDLETAHFRMEQVHGLFQKCVSIAAGPHHTLAVVAVATNPPPPPPPPAEGPADGLVFVDEPSSPKSPGSDVEASEDVIEDEYNGAGDLSKNETRFKDGVPSLSYLAEIAASKLVDVISRPSLATLTHI